MNTQSEAPDFVSLYQIEVPFIAELGTLTANARELLGLKVGGVLTLTRATGENINIYIGTCCWEREKFW